MRYLLLIHGQEDQLTPEDAGITQMMEGYRLITEEMEKDGVMRGGERLKPTSTATIVRVRDGKTLITDGPFIETREQLAGFYLIDCENLDQAIGYAQKIPGAGNGAIEVRPIMEMAR